MHGLERRVPLLIELDEFHRSCVIDPDLPIKSVRPPRNSVPE